MLDHLHQLALAVGGEDDPPFHDDFARLTATLVQVVSGYAGVQITILHSGHPIVLTVLHGDEPDGASHPGRAQQDVPSADRHPTDRRAITSVGVRLRSVSPRFDGVSRAVIYSRAPGSLVDLAADLSFALDGHASDTDGSPSSSPAVELDVDLPFNATETEATGLEELATIHRAIGFLIDRGHHPDTAGDTLRGHAASAGLTTHAFAIQLLAPSP
ncbi:MAG TPA: hypothetical protein VIT65_26705 [Microlunatus sp.]